MNHTFSASYDDTYITQALNELLSENADIDLVGKNWKPQELKWCTRGACGGSEEAYLCTGDEQGMRKVVNEVLGTQLIALSM